MLLHLLIEAWSNLLLLSRYPMQETFGGRIRRQRRRKNSSVYRRVYGAQHEIWPRNFRAFHVLMMTRHAHQLLKLLEFRRQTISKSRSRIVVLCRLVSRK